jgi:hypothetical protein
VGRCSLKTIHCLKTILQFKTGIPIVFVFLGLFLSIESKGQEPITTTPSAKCPPLDRNLLRQKLGAERSLKIVFFSTWCGDCTKHLQNLVKLSKSEHVLAVAVFDDQKKVEKVLQSMKLAIPCVMDDGLAKSLGVSVVPAEKSIQLKDLK